MNLRALGFDHLTRDDAKTFYYAWVLNAAPPKVATILKTDTHGAVSAMDRFMDSSDGLREFKEYTLKRLAKRGWFEAYDGRRIPIPDYHRALAAILQGNESVIMKTANVKWRTDAKLQHLKFRQVNWVHDEWQTTTPNLDTAESIAYLQRSSLEWAGSHFKMKCPLAGSSSIGRNWKETH